MPEARKIAATMKRFLALGLLGAALPGCSGARDAQAIEPEDRRAAIAEMYDGYRAEFPDVPEIDAPTLMQRRDEVMIVDVRTPEEQAVSMLPGAITQTAFEADKSAYKDKEIVTYCTIGYRSGLYAETLGEEGFRALNLKGSVLEWAHEGGEFVDPDGIPTQRVHVYGEEWNLLPDGYVPVW